MRRQLFVLMGPPGSGKSTFLKQNGLEDYVVSPDNLRLILGSLQQSIEQEWVYPNGKDRKVWELNFDIVSDRLKNGEPTIVDATHLKKKYWTKYSEMAKMHNADVYCVDFRGIAIDELLDRNKKRESSKKVPEEVIERMFQSAQQIKLPKTIKQLKPEEFIDFWNKKQIFDANGYKKIHHIGDIHGCIEPLEEILSEGIKEDELYIFLGDYIDRGINNVEVLRHMCELANFKNVIILEGNHERHLLRWFRGEKSNSKEFERFTRSELENKSFNRKKLGALFYQMKTFFAYEYQGKKVLCSHGGIAHIPDNFREISSDQMIRGVGTYKDDIDFYFNENNKNNEWYQVHGHRNIVNVSAYHYPKSLNLEGAVDKGGHLRTVTLDENGFHTKEIKNNKISSRYSHKKIETNQNFELINELRKNNNIKEKKHRNISSFNFSRKVFQKELWDKQTIKARGLYLDNETGEILARSYNKFFNLGEMGVDLNNLKEKLKTPIEIYEKENGFLGIVGLDNQNGKLLITTKSDYKGEMAKLFQQIFERNITPEAEEKMIDYIKEEDVTFLFEVIDPVNDPHITEYKNEELILLDIVKRDMEFSKKDFDEVIKIANDLGLRHKKKVATHNDYESLSKWLDEKLNEDPLDDEADQTEGYVIEGTNGYQIKVKTPYYAFWKWTRSQKDRLLKNKEINPEYKESKHGKLVYPVLRDIFNFNKNILEKFPYPMLISYMSHRIQNQKTKKK